MKFGLFMVAMSVVVCDGRSRVGSRGGSRNIGAASRRMLAGRSSKSRGGSRSGSRGGSRSKSSDPVMVEMRDVDWRVCLFGILVSVYFMYVYW